MSHLTVLILIALSIAYTNTIGASQEHQSKYMGQENRLIKSLSQNDIQQLTSGKGWGLAKAAELNGVPGPAHILEIKNEISLSKEQEEKIQLLFEKMKSKAIPLGEKLIGLERKLNQSFADSLIRASLIRASLIRASLIRNSSITNELLNQQLDAISNVRKQLRYVHLQTHLVTPTILTTLQIGQYNQLRGYGFR